MAVRFCGLIRIQITLQETTEALHHGTRYRCTLSLKGEHLATIVVEHTAELIRATDSAETYDSVASAALSFASYEGSRGSGCDNLASRSEHSDGSGTAIAEAADYSPDLSGWAIRRSKAFAKAAA